jgi:hypothetical protein
MNEGQCKVLKNMLIKHNCFLKQQKIYFKRTFEIKSNFDLSKVHNYHLVKVLKKRVLHLIYYFILKSILNHSKTFWNTI